MKIESTNVYVGPNMFARFPVIRHVLDLGELEHWPTVRLGGSFIEPLLATLPGLHEHGCSFREPGGFVLRLVEAEGTWMGHVMEHVALELQNVAGSDVTFGRTRSIEGRPSHDLAIRSRRLVPQAPTSAKNASCFESTPVKWGNGEGRPTNRASR